jgi:hypothetical protein
VVDFGVVFGTVTKNSTKKSELAAIHCHVIEGSPPSQELIDAQIAERFGWTFDELDQQDEGRVMRAVSLLNTTKAYRETMGAIEGHNPEAATPSHWNVYKAVQEAINES